MKLTHLSIRRWLLPIWLLLTAAVIIGGTLQWPVPLVYALAALMFAAVIGARSTERRQRREP